MEKVAVASSVKPKSQQANNKSVQKTEEQLQEADRELAFKADRDWFHDGGRDIDLSLVPAYSHLSINPFERLDRKESVSEKNEERLQELQTVSKSDEQTLTDENTEGETNPRGTQAENQITQEQSENSLIIDDSAVGLSKGQMRKTEFLQKLRTEICRTIEPVLISVGRTTDECPYLNYWLDLYQEKDAAHIERTAKKYAPESNGAETAAEYILTIAQRALMAAEIWSKTGKITGVPEGVPITLPNEEGFQKDNKGSEGKVLQFKPKKEGAKNNNDPALIQEELGEGQPLAAGVRSRMESACGVNLSHVRAHIDSKATAIANRVNARAFTIGNHIAFGNGEYQPDTLVGDALIAHELAHTIQQKGAKHSVHEMEMGNSGYDALERDADKAAEGAVRSLWTGERVQENGILERTIPLLRSGLRLQRCGHSSATRTSGPRTATGPRTAEEGNRGTRGSGACPTVISITTQVANATVSDSCRNDCRMGLGCCTTPRGQCGISGTSGAATTAIVETVAGCTGELAFMQNILSTNRRRTLTSGTEECLTTTSPHRDGITPWKGCVVPVNSAGRHTIQSDDCPNIKLRDNMSAASTTETFKTFLVWKPTGASSRMPIANVNWGWSGATTRKKGTSCVTNWTSPTGNSTQGTGSASQDQPVVTPVIQDLDWAPCS